jgi:outer membrane protein assembly factor BamB
LLERKLYGRPISVHSLEKFPKIPNNCVNMVWLSSPSKESPAVSSPDSATNTFSNLERCLTPAGFFISEPMEFGPDLKTKGYTDVSTAASGAQQIAVHRKPRLEGSAGWTHMYGLADNTAFAGETLSGAAYAEQLEVTWAGRPGPRYQSDRGNRKPSPLAANGRLYLQGHQRLLGLDAHNGSILWAKEMPKMVRFNIPRDCSNWCCDSQAVYVAVDDNCLKLDGATGEQLAEFTAVQDEHRKLHWGFVSRQDDLLIGSSVAPSASFTEYWGKEFWYDAKEGETAKKVASDVLFAVDSDTGVERWRYDSALIINPTIAISDGKIVFTECRSEQLRDAQQRRLDGDELWNNIFIVALDIHTGRTLWESPAQPLPGVSAMYGVSTQDQYLLQTSAGGEFAIYSLELETGKMQWRGKYGWEADHHGKHLSRPAVVGNKIYLRPLTLDRISGKVLSKTFPVGHQCGTYTCTSNALFLRAGNLAMWDGNSTGATRWDRLRPDCWISTIPAEGMLLSPEGGGGCSCGGWIETSVGFGTRM